MTVQSTDKTEAADEIHYLIDSKTGTASAATQKVLTDGTTGQSVEAGDPVDLALTDAEQTKFLADADTSLTAILAARVSVSAPAADQSDASATDTAAATDSPAGSDTAPVQS